MKCTQIDNVNVFTQHCKKTLKRCLITMGKWDTGIPTADAKSLA